MSEESRHDQAAESGDVVTCDRCAGEWVLACHHGRWCGAHITGHQQEDEFCRIALARAEVMIYRRFFVPLFRLREEIMPVASSLLEHITPFAAGFCAEVSAQCRGVYEAHGSPFGEGDEEMWRWLEEVLDHATN